MRFHPVLFNQYRFGSPSLFGAVGDLLVSLGPLAYYPRWDGDEVTDYSGNDRHASHYQIDATTQTGPDGNVYGWDWILLVDTVVRLNTTGRIHVVALAHHGFTGAGDVMRAGTTGGLDSSSNCDWRAQTAGTYLRGFKHNGGSSKQRTVNPWENGITDWDLVEWVFADGSSYPAMYVNGVLPSGSGSGSISNTNGATRLTIGRNVAHVAIFDHDPGPTARAALVASAQAEGWIP